MYPVSAVTADTGFLFAELSAEGFDLKLEALMLGSDLLKFRNIKLQQQHDVFFRFVVGFTGMFDRPLTLPPPRHLAEWQSVMPKFIC